MPTVKRLLSDATVKECGHRLQVWAEIEESGEWSLHFNCECQVCEGIADRIAASVAPHIKVIRSC